jgi:uncharacterized membrane protein
MEVQMTTALSLWLHDLATIVLIGHYLLFALVYQPVMKQDLDETQAARLVKKIFKRMRLWLGLALLVFLVTGVLLMFANPNYLGVGNFGNSWSILMVIKHIVVIAIIALDFWVQRVMTAGAMEQKGLFALLYARFSGLPRLIQTQALLGTLVLLLTAFARIG